MELISGNIGTESRADFFPLRHKQVFAVSEDSRHPFRVHKSPAEKNIEVEKAKLRKAAQGFEAIFIRKLLSTMRSTMSENSMFGKGVTGEIYGDIIDSAVAEDMSEKGVLGFGDMLYRSLVKTLETEL